MSTTDAPTADGTGCRDARPVEILDVLVESSLDADGGIVALEPDVAYTHQIRGYSETNDWWVAQLVTSQWGDDVILFGEGSRSWEATAEIRPKRELDGPWNSQRAAETATLDAAAQSGDRPELRTTVTITSRRVSKTRLIPTGSTPRHSCELKLDLTVA